MCIGVSAPLRNATPLFLPIPPFPPINLQTVQASFFKEILAFYWFFVNPFEKSYNIKI